MQHKTTSFYLLGSALVFVACGGNNTTTDAPRVSDTSIPIDAALPDATVPIDAGSGSGSGSAQSFLYIETNGAGSNNQVLEFALAAGSGSGSGSAAERVDLTLIGAVSTGGAGLAAGSGLFGPLDSSQQIIASSDGANLFAVNSGSDTVASFAIGADGVLTPVTGSPFAVGGANPVSLGLVGTILYIAEKEVSGKAIPRYAAASVASDGALTAISTGGANGQRGGSPTTVYVSPDGKLVFGTEFFDSTRAGNVPIGQIDVFVPEASGVLTPAPGSPHALPVDNSGIKPPPAQVALGVISHPTQKVLYVAFPTRSQIGVYTYTDAGTLTFVRTVRAGLDVCCFAIDPSGQFLFAVNTGIATISTYALTTPEAPRLIGNATLAARVSGPPFTDANGVRQTFTSLPSEIAIDATGTHLFVLSQRVTTNKTDLAGNLLHILDIESTGQLTEQRPPIDLTSDGVPATARPQGLLVVTPQ